MTKVIVLLSGGQDSTTALYWAKAPLSPLDVVGTVSFDYGQRHLVELDLAGMTAARAGVPHHVLPLDVLSRLGQASLTNPRIMNDGSPGAVNAFAVERGLPQSFVPGRNLLFFTLAAALAAKEGATAIVTGVCQQDRAGYPDCREESVRATAEAIREGFDWPEFSIIAPLLDQSKANTWKMAAELGVLDEIIEHTNTCYEGNRNLFHEWGYGCGVCGACVERARGYAEWASVAA
jgi:7-cyano-7-deazaguanine synthase